MRMGGPNRGFATTLASVLAGLVVIAAPAWAQKTYKWVDKDGRVQYSDKPPTGATAQPLETRIGSVTSSGQPGAAKGTVGPKSLAEQDQAFRKRQIEAQEKATKQAKSDQESRQKAEACNNARGRLAGLDAGGRQRRFDSKGEAVFLDEGQIEAEKQQARRDISSYCAG